MRLLVLAFLCWFCRKGTSLSFTERTDRSSCVYRISTRMAESYFRNIKSFCVSIISLRISKFKQFRIYFTNHPLNSDLMKCRNPVEGCVFLKTWQEEYLFWVQNYLVKKKSWLCRDFFRTKIHQEVLMSLKTCLNLRWKLYLYFVAANMTHIANNFIK